MDIVLDKTKRPPFNGGPFARYFARLLLAGVFATAATAKLQSFVQFERTLAASRLVPNGLFYASAVAIIALELTVALGLVFPLLQPILQKISLGIAAMLSSVFISYSVWRWLENIQVPCHCFGLLFRLNPPAAILLNAVLLALIAYALSGNHPVQRPKLAPL